MREALKTFFWILVVTIVAPLVAGYVLRKYQEYNHNRKLRDDEQRYLGDNYQESFEEEEPNLTPRPEFDLSQPLQTVKTTSFEPELTINTSQFLKIYNTNAFLKLFQSAILKTMKYKKDFYVKEYIKVSRLINQANINSGLDHDINNTRNLKYQKVLITILDSIREKIKTVTVRNIKKNLHTILFDTVNGFASVRGRQTFKDFLVRRLFAFAKNPMVFNRNPQNILLLGNSGIGKTKLARLVGFTYSKSGIFMRDIFQEVTPEKLMSEYVSSSANMTRQILEQSLEGVCFIDEIYALNPKTGAFQGANHGKESTDAIVAFAEPNDGKIAIVGAGYGDKVKSQFLSVNEGLARRFPHVFTITDYSSQELTEICIDFLYQPGNDFKLTNSEAVILYNLINRLYSEYPDIFEKQAGDMKILSESILTSDLNSVSSSDDNTPIIIQGLRQYLSAKGYTLTHETLVRFLHM